MSLRGTLLGLVVALLATLPALSDGDFDAKLRRWQKLPKEEQARLRERYEAWKRLPESVRKDLTQRFHAMPPGRVEKLKARFAELPKGLHKSLIMRLRSLRPEQRAQFREVFKVVRALPEDERQRLRELPPRERKERLRTLVYDRIAQEHLRALPKEEQKRFEALPPEQKLQRVRVWFREKTRSAPR